MTKKTTEKTAREGDGVEVRGVGVGRLVRDEQGRLYVLLESRLCRPLLFPYRDNLNVIKKRI
jgi:hypothetical protein